MPCIDKYMVNSVYPALTCDISNLHHVSCNKYMVFRPAISCYLSPVIDRKRNLDLISGYKNVTIAGTLARDYRNSIHHDPDFK